MGRRRFGVTLLSTPEHYLFSEEEAKAVYYNLIKFIKYKYGNRTFWSKGYQVDTVGKNTKKIREYINNPLKEDCMAYQIRFSEYIDPCTSEKVNK